LSDEVDDPAQDVFARVPAAVPSRHFLDRSRFAWVSLGVQGLRYHAIDGVEKVVPKAVHAAGAALSDLDEIVHEDVCCAYWSLEGPVGGGSAVFWLWRERDDARDRGQGCVSLQVVWLWGSRGAGADIVVHGPGQSGEAVWFCVEWVGLEPGVGHITDGFRHGGESRRRLDPAHGACQRDPDHLGLSFEFGQQQSESETVVRVEGHLVEAILEVVLATADRSIARVGVSSQVEHSVQGSAKLHGLRRSVRDGSFVDGAPWPGPGVVAEEARLSISFWFDGGGGEHQVRKVAHLVVGQHCPEPILDELGHFFADEVSMLVCGGVAASLDALVFLLESPGFGSGLSRNPFVSPLGQ
jgi:hypothetical protein